MRQQCLRGLPNSWTAGLDDLTVPLAPTADAVDDDEQARLTHPIGRDKVARSVIVAHNLNSKATLT